MLARGRHLMKVVAAAVDTVRRPPPGLIVLVYHRVGRRAAIETDLPMSLFEEQIASLAEQAEVLPLDGGLRAVTTTPSSPSSIVAVTFDDGTADFADLALPVLVRHNVPVTLYLATEFIEERRPFPHGGLPLSWGALRDARSTGLVSVGSHTHRHALLDRLPSDEVADELDRSIGLIEDHLGDRPADFAYPKAIPGSSTADQAVRARFRSAALAGTKPNPFGATDLHRLARSPVQMSDGMQWFLRKARGGLEFEDQIRGVVNRRRYRHATR